MERELGKEIEAGQKRADFLEDNCDEVVEKGYMKQYSPEELAQLKESLSETDIQINDIEGEKKDAMKGFKARIDPLELERKRVLSGLKLKAEYVTEKCFKFIDQDGREVGFYNQAGDLIESRPANADEMQKNIFQDLRKTGTNNN